jgi:hypothetical protein
VEKGGCAAGRCFDTNQALITIKIMRIALAAAVLLFAFHFSTELKSRAVACWSSYSRAREKRRRAEQNRKEARERARELEEAETAKEHEAMGRVVWRTSVEDLPASRSSVELTVRTSASASSLLQAPQEAQAAGRLKHMTTLNATVLHAKNAEALDDDIDGGAEDLYQKFIRTHTKNGQRVPAGGPAAPPSQLQRITLRWTRSAGPHAPPSFLSAMGAAAAAEAESKEQAPADDDGPEDAIPVSSYKRYIDESVPIDEADAQLAKAGQAPSRERLISLGKDARERAEVLRTTLLQELAQLNVQAKTLVGVVRRQMGILNASNSILRELRLSVVTQFRVFALSMLRKGGLFRMSLQSARRALEDVKKAHSLIASALKVPDRLGDARQQLIEAREIIRAVARVVASPVKGSMGGHTALSALKWELTDPRFLTVQMQVEAELESKDKRVDKMLERVLLAGTSFVSSTNVGNLPSGGCCASFKRFLVALLLPNFIRTHPVFYFVFFLGMFLTFIRFVARIGIDSNQDIRDAGTFLNVPAYYELESESGQRILVPLIYAVMHCALYCFCWLPVPFMRGVWRDLSRIFPRLRNWIPIDDMVFFHKMLGVMILSFLLSGGFLFFFSLSKRCEDGHHQSCRGFYQLNEEGLRDRLFHNNPLENVLALRKVVWTLWFPLMPLLHWAHISPPRCLPNVLRQNWYEFVYYGHHLVAHASFVLVMICRFEVFFPSVLPWGLYYLDTIREMLLNTYTTTAIVRPTMQDLTDSEAVRSSTVHTDGKGRPTLVTLLMDKPLGFKPGAGQVVYIKVPEISRIQWHPFSLSSGSLDNHLELQIGVVSHSPDQWKEGSEKNTEETLPLKGLESAGAAAIKPRIPEDEWKMVHRPTFTYQLQQLVRQRITEMAFLDDPEAQSDQVQPLRILLRGPYGSAFTRCFNPDYTGCVVIGAGTGLTAALSVLREIIQRRKKGDAVPQYVWFVWSCRTTDDLLWAWTTLLELLLNAVMDGVLRPGPHWTTKSNMLDWLGITIYVTGADKAMLDEFLVASSSMHHARAEEAAEEQEAGPGADDDEKAAPTALESEDKAANQPSRLLSLRARRQRYTAEQELHEWLSNERHLIRGSMDDEEYHIRNLLAWARLYINRKGGRHKKMTACYCGPPALAHVISKASRAVGAGLEFSAEHQ